MNLTTSEQKHLLSNPLALAILMDHHDQQQDQADSMGAECVGDELRREELRQHGAKIIEADPGIWPEDLRKQFAAPTGHAAQRLAQARRFSRVSYPCGPNCSFPDCACGVTDTQGDQRG